MTMEIFSKYVSYAGILFAWICIFCLIVSFIYFGMNKKNYEVILEKYKSTGFPLPGAYSFHSMMGFWGAFPMIYFFRCLMAGKKPRFCFGGKVYSGDLFMKIQNEQKKWMDVYYGINIINLISILLFFVAGSIKYVINVYLL